MPEEIEIPGSVLSRRRWVGADTSWVFDERCRQCALRPGSCRLSTLERGISTGSAIMRGRREAMERAPEYWQRSR